jgi:hypothetical protein
MRDGWSARRTTSTSSGEENSLSSAIGIVHWMNERGVKQKIPASSGSCSAARPADARIVSWRVSRGKGRKRVSGSGPGNRTRSRGCASHSASRTGAWGSYLIQNEVGNPGAPEPGEPHAHKPDVFMRLSCVTVERTTHCATTRSTSSRMENSLSSVISMVYALQQAQCVAADKIHTVSTATARESSVTGRKEAQRRTKDGGILAPRRKRKADEHKGLGTDQRGLKTAASPSSCSLYTKTGVSSGVARHDAKRS